MENITEKYIIKEKEGIVICILEDNSFNASIDSPKVKKFKGIARLSPHDTFDVEIGKKIAFKKAIIERIRYIIELRKKTMNSTIEKKKSIEEKIEKQTVKINRMKKSINKIKAEIASF